MLTLLFIINFKCFTEDVAVTTRPYINYCRSPNMEDFSCWWQPLSNLTGGEATYVLTYSKEYVTKHEGTRSLPTNRELFTFRLEKIKYLLTLFMIYDQLVRR